MQKVSIIIVNYNTADEITACISSIHKYTKGIDYEIIIVDNNSENDNKRILKEKYSEERLYFLSSNTGFAFANNYGMKRCKSKYVLLLNPDTYLLENSIKEMVEFMDKRPNIGAVGPMLINKDGSSQLPYSRFPDLKQHLLEAVYCHKILQRNSLTTTQRESLLQGLPFDIDWISGACFLLRRNVYEDIGGLDEHFHLYVEDVDWCLRIKKAGWKIYCFSQTNVVHIRGAATHKDYFSLIKSRYESRFIFAKKHFSPVQMFIVRMIVFLALSIRMVRALLCYYSDRKENRDRIAGYLFSMQLWSGIIKLSNQSPGNS